MHFIIIIQFQAICSAKHCIRLHRALQGSPHLKHSGYKNFWNLAGGEVGLPWRARRNLMFPDPFSAFIRWWVNTSSRSSAYSSKDMSEASIGAGFAAAATRRRRLYVYHTWRPSIARRCSTLQFWSRGPATQKERESYKVLHLTRKSNLTILKSWPCEKTQEKMQIVRLETRKKWSMVGNA